MSKNKEMSTRCVVTVNIKNSEYTEKLTFDQNCFNLVMPSKTLRLKRIRLVKIDENFANYLFKTKAKIKC